MTRLAAWDVFTQRREVFTFRFAVAISVVVPLVSEAFDVIATSLVEIIRTLWLCG